jgi:hypothetical protein
LKKSANRLLKNCERSHVPIDCENAVAQVRRKARNAYIEVLSKSELRPT